MQRNAARYVTYALHFYVICPEVYITLVHMSRSPHVPIVFRSC